MPRCVVRESAFAASIPSGTKTSDRLFDNESVTERRVTRRIERRVTRRLERRVTRRNREEGNPEDREERHPEDGGECVLAREARAHQNA
jgi:hypothetical protein